ncbi:MAG: hypothetical protein WD708_09130 [Kiritimatiellia bacterium]
MTKLFYNCCFVLFHSATLMLPAHEALPLDFIEILKETKVGPNKISIKEKEFVYTANQGEWIAYRLKPEKDQAAQPKPDEQSIRE